MRILGFDWDDTNRDKLRLHDLEPDDVEALFDHAIRSHLPIPRSEGVTSLSASFPMAVSRSSSSSTTRKPDGSGWSQRMSRPIRAGGTGTRARKASLTTKRPPEEFDPDAVEFEAVDWAKVEPVEVELDPAVAERIRSSRLQPITMRVGAEQIAAARRVAERTGTKYQAVLRRWLAEGASRERTLEIRGRRIKSRG